jgi:hypothetical protein
MPSWVGDVDGRLERSEGHPDLWLEEKEKRGKGGAPIMNLSLPAIYAVPNGEKAAVALAI